MTMDDPKVFSTRLKARLLESGASLVGFADVTGRYVGDGAADLSARYPKAVSIAVNVPRDVVMGIENGPTMAYWEAYHTLNARLDALARLCADMIKDAGFQAHAQTLDAVKEFDNYRTTLPHKTAAVWAGLGFIGKCALFVSREYGSAVRLTSVLTDAPIDCWQGQPRSLCGDCTRCRDACPGQAVSGRLWSPGLDRDAFFDPLKCRAAARRRAKQMIDKEITLCGKCIQICPFTQRYLQTDD